MKAKLITYWIATILVCGMMGMSAFAYLTKEPKMVAAFASLGYPLYFMTLLGVAKFLGIAALLSPRLALVKEWAYAGFAYCCIGAGISHLAVHENPQAVIAFGSLLPLGLSYFLRSADRRVIAPSSPRHPPTARTSDGFDLGRASHV